LKQLLKAEFQIYKFITFISEEQIDEESWLFANELVSDIDPKSIVYIALAQQFDCKLWIGDKKLINGLTLKKYHNILTTDDLFFIKKKWFL
jgi:predicted nucleic acid-binding protein